MVRAVTGFAGLSLRGTGTVGPLLFELPGLLYAGSGVPAASVSPSRGTIVERTAPPGSRAITLRGPGGELPLSFPVFAAEVSGVPGDLHEAATGAWVIHAPLSDAQWERLAVARPELVVLGNSRVLFQEGEPFVDLIRELRSRLGGGPILWAPRCALPHRLALLTYLGVDLLDTTEGVLRTAAGSYLDPLFATLTEAEARREHRCDCPSCRSDPPGPRQEHTDWLYSRELAIVRSVHGEGRLRELVESRLTSEPLLAEVLRYADRNLGGLLEERAPVVASGEWGYVLRESHRRPEIVRFRRRFLERYRAPPTKRVLLLVPCSRTKPYRKSRSHRRFAGALEELPHLERVHLVSVTSPLGLVPRELEDVYPARHYDIPVTGEWDEGERLAVVGALRHLLSTGSYTHLVAHLDPAEYGFLRAEIPETVPTVWSVGDERTTSSGALGSLREAVSSALTGLDPVSGGPLATVREELECVARLQFGPDAAERLFRPPIRLAGRPWFQRLTDGHGTDLATWREERGWFHLTVAGGLRLHPAHPLEVEVADGFELTGDLFAPGVARSDPGIRLGDDVLLVRSGELLGVGEAALPGNLMTQLSRGLAVHIRHRAHPALREGRPTPT